LKTVPTDGILDTILGYSRMIDRNLNRAYERLERPQQRRKEERVTPFLNLNVNA
jgi:hypothetical protein